MLADNSYLRQTVTRSQVLYAFSDSFSFDSDDHASRDEVIQSAAQVHAGALGNLGGTAIGRII